MTRTVAVALMRPSGRSGTGDVVGCMWTVGAVSVAVVGINVSTLGEGCNPQPPVQLERIVLHPGERGGRRTKSSKIGR